jgi:DNA polymerase I
MIMLIDGGNLAFRNYAVNSDLRSSKGEGTGAIYGTLKSVYLLKKLFKPQRIVVFWDSGNSEWRMGLYPAYKAHRRNNVDQERAVYMDEYHRQLGEVREALDMLAVPQISVRGVEADDLIGMATYQLLRDMASDITIVSSDKDFYQLLGPRVNILQAHSKSSSVYEFMTTIKFESAYGFNPSCWPDMRAMMGDSSDNIPGVRGVGETHATRLIREYGSLSKIIQDESSTDRYVEKVREQSKEAQLYRRISTLTLRVDERSPFYDKSTAKLIHAEMDKLNWRALLLRKSEFNEFCFVKEMTSIHDKVGEWFYLFGGMDMLKNS